MREFIVKWLENSILEIEKKGFNDIHFDEIENVELRTQNDIISLANNISNILRDSFQNKMRSDLSLLLYVYLISESNELLGLPKSFKDLLSRIDLSYSPDIVLSKKVSGINLEIEMYRSCLPFEMDCIDGIDILYREHRDCESLKENDWYTRELLYIIF